MKYLIDPEIETQNYISFLKVAFIYSTHFSLTTFKSYHQKDLRNSYYNMLEMLASYEKDNSFFKVPAIYRKGQRYHIYELNNYTENAIKSVGSIYNWLLPEYPEDLAFYNQKQVWLYSISHEKLCFVETSNNEILKSFSDIGLHFIKE